VPAFDGLDVLLLLLQQVALAQTPLLQAWR
jgi:hypothetical protein